MRNLKPLLFIGAVGLIGAAMLHRQKKQRQTHEPTPADLLKRALRQEFGQRFPLNPTTLRLGSQCQADGLAFCEHPELVAWAQPANPTWVPDHEHA